MTRKEAYAEAKKRTRLGYPHRVIKGIRHDLMCLVSDGLITPRHDCTCGSKEVKYYIQLGK